VQPARRGQLVDIRFRHSGVYSFTAGAAAGEECQVWPGAGDRARPSVARKYFRGCLFLKRAIQTLTMGPPGTDFREVKRHAVILSDVHDQSLPSFKLDPSPSRRRGACKRRGPHWRSCWTRGAASSSFPKRSLADIRRARILGAGRHEICRGTRWFRRYFEGAHRCSGSGDGALGGGSADARDMVGDRCDRTGSAERCIARL